MTYFEAMYTPAGMTAEEMSREKYVCPETGGERLGELPAITGVVCGADPLRDEGASYFRAVEAAGGEVDWRQWDYTFHGGDDCCLPFRCVYVCVYLCICICAWYMSLVGMWIHML